MWVVVFEVERDARAKMLASDSSHGSTESARHALPSDRSEVVDPAVLRPHWAEDAAARRKSAEKVDGYRRRSRQLRDQVRRAAQEAG